MAARPQLPPVLWWWLVLFLRRLDDHWDRWVGVSWPTIRDGTVFEGPSWAVRVSAAADLLTNVLLVLALVYLALPPLRRWTIRRAYGLAPADDALACRVSDATDGALASIPVDTNLVRTDRTAFVYPSGLRASIAVFAPLARSLRSSPDQAAFVLHHEIAHARTGDHLITGAGSPLRLIARFVFPALILLTLVSAILPDPLGEARVQTTVFMTNAVVMVFGLAAALWVAELEADRVATAATSRAVGLDALDRTSGRARLSHPPRWLRRALVRWSHRAPAAILLLLLYPLTAAARWGVLVVGNVFAMSRFSETTAQEAWTTIGGGALAAGEVSAREMIWFGILVMIWPLISPAWHRLWIPSSADSQRPQITAANTVAGLICIGVSVLVILGVG